MFQYDNKTPIYQASSAVKTILFRALAKKVMIEATPLRRTDLMASHIRAMHPEAFAVIWEGHVAEMGGSQYTYEHSEAREIFLIAVEAALNNHVVNW